MCIYIYVCVFLDQYLYNYSPFKSKTSVAVRVEKTWF